MNKVIRADLFYFAKESLRRNKMGIEACGERAKESSIFPPTLTNDERDEYIVDREGKPSRTALGELLWELMRREREIEGRK